MQRSIVKALAVAALASALCLYMEKAPIFVTTKLADIEQLREAAMPRPGTNLPGNADASMICRRLKIHPFTTVTQQPAHRVEPCGRCFAQLVLQQSGA